MHKINRDSVSVMLSLKVADVERSSKRARLVERQVASTVSQRCVSGFYCVIMYLYYVVVGFRLSGGHSTRHLGFIKFGRRRTRIDFPTDIHICARIRRTGIPSKWAKFKHYAMDEFGQAGEQSTCPT